jgi:xanthine dehydrogenase accessory factor
MRAREPGTMAAPKSCLSIAGEATESVVLVTLIGQVGSTPQDVGAKMVVDARGLRAGSVGGGKVEARAIVTAQAMLDRDGDTPRCVVHEWNLQRELGMTCGGEVTLLFEQVLVDAWRVVVFGAGHVAQALVRALLLVDASIVCVDDRTEWIERLPADSRLVVRRDASVEGVVSDLRAADAVVCMTMGHARDVEVLRAIAARGLTPRYLGVIGSAAKRIALLKTLGTHAVPSEWTSQIRCPIGLPIGTNHPGEIAISVVAELLSTRDAPVVPRGVSSP